MEMKTLSPAEKLWGVFGIVFVLSSFGIGLHGAFNGAEASKRDKNIALAEKQRKIMELTDALAFMGRPLKNQKVLWNQDQRECLEIAIAHEAGDYKDKRIERADVYMVASTIINRHRAGEGTICKIVSDPVQFSYNREPDKFPKSIGAIKKNKGDKYKIIQDVVARLSNEDMKPMAGLMWYNNTKASRNTWHLSKLKDQSFCGLSVGKHMFYQLNRTGECPLIKITEL